MGSFLKNGSSIAEQIASPLTSVASIYNNERNVSAQNRANEMNLQENERNRQFNSREAQLQRDFESQQVQIANQFNADEALKAFQRSSKFAVDMWNKENEYNSPTSQIKRLVDAGVNPNVFGGDNTTGSVASVAQSAPSANLSHGSSASVGGSIPVAPVTYTNPLLESAQIRNINAQSDKLNSDTDLNKANKQRLLELLTGEKELQRFEILGKQFDVEKMKPSQVENLIAQTNNFNANARNLDENTKKLHQEIANLLESQKLTQEQVKRAKIENQYLPDVLFSEIKKNLSEVIRNEEQASLLAQEATNALLEGGSLALSFDIDEKSHQDNIEITKSENDWTKLKNHWRGKYPRLSYAIETSSSIIGGVSRGVGSAVGRIGSAIMSLGK